jgi:L-threonylcarbamoyladenylate synthase
MITVIIGQSLSTDKKPDCAGVFEEIGRIIRRGGAIVYPTETLYALGASARDERAVESVYRMKKRPKGTPISIAVGDVSEIGRYAVMTGDARQIAEKYLPGPVTLVLKNRGRLKAIKGEKIGIRVPRHPVALSIVKACGPVTATSANIHGGKLPATVRAARGQLGGSVDVYIDAGRCRYMKGSTVIDLTGKSPRILREGAIPSEKLEDCINAARR